MKNLFKRPQATALFIFDGLSDGKFIDITVVANCGSDSVASDCSCVCVFSYSCAII